MSKVYINIENWFISYKSLVGEVYGHPDVFDGETITTSRLTVLDMKNKYAETIDHVYLLGKPHKISETKVEGFIQ